MQLDKFQNKFKETMFQPVGNLPKNSEEFDGVFNENNIPVHERLKVYHNNVIGSISAALCATFPLLENLVGKDFLKSMARAFIFENPPQMGCLQMYGAGFDNFIQTYEPAKKLAYLPDIATLEFALNHAYYAGDDNALTADYLANIKPEKIGDVVLNLRKSASLISSRYPLIEIRDFCLNENEANHPNLTKEHKCFILILRPEFEVNLIALAEDELMVLTLLNENIPLGEAVENTTKEFPDFDFTAFLQKHIELETFSTLTTKG